jgi:hypothetical protein
MLLTLVAMFYKFVNRIIMFEEALQFWITIVLCYNK